MTALGHTAAASLFRGHPLLRVLWGVVSHAILDYTMPEYRPKDIYLTRPSSWLHPWLLMQVVGCLLFALVTGDWWAIFYGMLPDAIEALWVAFVKFGWGIDIWMTGELLFPWHRPRPGVQEWTFRRSVLVELGMMALVVWLYT